MEDQQPVQHLRHGRGLFFKTKCAEKCELNYYYDKKAALLKNKEYQDRRESDDKTDHTTDSYHWKIESQAVLKTYENCCDENPLPNKVEICEIKCLDDHDDRLTLSESKDMPHDEFLELEKESQGILDQCHNACN